MNMWKTLLALLALQTGTVLAFVPRSAPRMNNNNMATRTNNKEHDDDNKVVFDHHHHHHHHHVLQVVDDETTISVPDQNRRQTFANILLGGLGCASSYCCVSPAYGLAQITAPPPEALSTFDLPRNQLQDAAFAQGMAVGMVSYEREAYPTKKRLFQTLLSSLGEDAVVAEVGMGSFPNALYYKKNEGLDIIGIDPNDLMEGYARDNAARAGLLPKNSLRIVHGVSEALPLEDNSCDAVVCTLTLCSVVDPAKSVAEIKRVLKPGGKFLFWEHVLSKTDKELAQQQIDLTPNQVKRADGCHLDRQTGEVIRLSGFKHLDLEYMELENFRFLNPTVCGIATA